MLTTINKINEYLDQEVRLGGWVYNKRSSGKIQFLELRDGTGFIQCIVIKNKISDELWGTINNLTQESSVYVTGLVTEDKRSSGGFEILLTNLEVIQLSEEYPISKKEHGVDFLLDLRHLWIRSPIQKAILTVRSEIIKAIRHFFDKNGFTQVDPPILTPSSCEGTTDLFQTSYFGEEAYLTQSGQLYMEAAAMALNKVYSFGPTFRAEKSKTRRHLIEFWMIEPEMAFVTHEENLKIQEQFLSHIVTHVLENCKDELNTLGRDITQLSKITPSFPRITYDEAINILHENGFEDFKWGEDLGAPHETLIAEKFDLPVFITHYPTQLKSFYMKPDPTNPEVVLCADLIAPEGYGEIIGGSERISDLKLMEQRFKEHNLSNDSYRWYLELRKYGSVPHSGFGLGLERTVAWICGLKHVRETIPFPRMLNRLYP